MSWRERRREKKAAKRLAKARKAIRGKQLDIVPPEGVPLQFKVAGIGARLGAQLLDLLVTVVGAVAFALALIFAFDVGFRTGTALVGLFAFMVRTPYYIVFELLWNGRTPAKKWLGLRTISRDGRSLRAYQIVVRNLMREIEFFTPVTYLLAGAAISGWIQLLAAAWIVILIIVPWRSANNQRLGDIIAGTAVIEEPKAVLIADVSRVETARVGPDPVEERFTFTTSQLDAYGAYELQVLERLLRAPLGEKGKPPTDVMIRRRSETMTQVADRIRAKIGYDERVPPRETEAFLQAFYRAERAYLESRKLFGENREDKTYREKPKEEV